MEFIKYRKLTAILSQKVADLQKKAAALEELRRRGNVIYTITATVLVECVAIPSDIPVDRLTSARVGTVVTFHVADWTTYRFTNPELAATIYESKQGTFRVRFIYEPEDTSQFLGSQIDKLLQIITLSVNYASVLGVLGLHFSRDATIKESRLQVNGIEVVALKELRPMRGDLAAGEAIFDVAPAFIKVATRYTSELEASIRKHAK